MVKKPNQKKWVRYSESFKLEVVHQIEEEGLSIEAARRRYGIGSSATVHKWLHKYGKHRSLAKRVIVMKADEQRLEKKQAERIKELESALVKLQLDNLAMEAYLDIACERLGEPTERFKKKVKEKGCSE